MNRIDAVFDWVLRTSWQASVLIVLVLLAQRLFRRHLSARWRAALWLLVLIRLVLPLSLNTTWSLFNYTGPGAAAPWVERWFPQENPEDAKGFRPVKADDMAVELQRRVESARTAEAQPATTVSSPASLTLGGRLRKWAAWFWLLGMVALSLRLIWRNGWFVWQLRQCRAVASPEVLEVLAECRQMMRVRTGARLVETDLVQSPALYGLVRQRLLLPVGMMDRLTREERRYMLLHELAHLKHRDTYINWLLSLLRVLHWFNPLVWYAFHRVRLDRELACDELVLAITAGKGREVYGQTIINLLERRFGPVRNPALTGIVETKDQIERRIDMIAKFKLVTGRPLLTALLFAALAAVTLTDAQTERETKSLRSDGITKTDLSGQPGGRHPVTTAQVGATSASKSIDAEFPVVARFTGANDVIQYTTSLNVSPNGKFLLWGVTVVPMGGGEPFKLTDIAGAGRGSWSPDGAKVVFYAGPIWMIAVSAETGKPAGPVKKLLDGDYWAYARVRWSPDSQHIVFEEAGPEVGGSVCLVSVSDGRLKRLTTEPGRHRFPVWSSDGRTILYSKEASLFQIPAEGGAAKKLAVNGNPIGWSADAKWLVLVAGKQLLFHNVDSGETRQAEFLVEAGECVGKSPTGKLLFYRPSYDFSLNSKVVDVSGAQPLTVQQNIEIYTWIWQDCWTRDSKNVVGLATSGDKMDMIPATGGQPKTIQLDVSTDGEIVHRFPSPDLRRLLFSVKREPGRHDLWVVPLSLRQMRTVGKPVKILTGCKVPDILGGPRWGVWSPDSKRIAVHNGNDLWVVSASGKEARPITDGPGRKSSPAWSPNGQMIAYVQHDGAPLSLRVVAASGGQGKTLYAPAAAGSHLAGGDYVWSRDGDEVLFTTGGGIFTTGGGISAVNVATGKTRQVVDLTELGEGYARTLRWPPGKDYLCFLWTSKAQDLSTLYRVRPQSRTLEKIADGILVGYSWSPDGRKVAYDTLTHSKNRPEGLLREFDLEAKLAALVR